VSLKPICGLAIALGLSRVASGEPLAIRTTGPLPFTVAELETALALRASSGVATSEAGPQIVAQVSSVDSRVLVSVGGRLREVALDGQGGADAARLVAFAILDLAGDQLDPPAAAEPAIVATEAPIFNQPLVFHDRYEPRWTLGVWGTAGSQLGATLGGAVELGLPVAGALRATVSVGSGERTLLGTATLRTIPLRVGLAWRRIALPLGALEVRADALGVIADASAMRSDTSLVLGGGAALVWAVQASRSMRGWGVTLLIGGGVDGFATARDYRVDGVPIAATDRVAAWAGVGLAGEVWR
jgi:hypothetical protein